MCQACLALAQRRSGASSWPLGDSKPAPSPGRFAAAAEWADEGGEAQAADPSAPEEDGPPVDARRS